MHANRQRTTMSFTEFQKRAKDSNQMKKTHAKLQSVYSNFRTKTWNLALKDNILKAVQNTALQTQKNLVISYSQDSRT